MSSYAPDAGGRVGTVVNGRFRIEKMLGAGGMGAVYVASASNGHSYALKLLLHDRLGANAELVARFVREAKLAASVVAPNVVHTYECSVDQATGAPLIVMELLDGRDADALVRELGPLEPTAAVRIVLQAAKGLSAAHAAGIVHRDIKPANLFLHRAGGGGRRGAEIVVKVCDFGIAKAVVADDESLTVTGTPLGTPLYLSPEQMRSAKHVDPRTDVWSLGMTLWTLLGGESPYQRQNSLGELFVAICTQDVPWLQDRAPWVDPELARVIHGTLLRDLPQRCPDLDALVEALTPFAGGTDELHEADLVGVTEVTRSRDVGRGTRPSSWSESIPQRAGAPVGDPQLRALLGKTLGGRYRLDRLLGAGGMGAVFEAVAANGERVAVKIILGDPDRQKPEILRRFVREARATMSIQSPNVVNIVDVDADPQQGFPFIVMELLSGTDLDKLIRTSGALDPHAVAKLFVQACVGLGAAHAKGVLHRDVKPANVFLHQSPDGRVRVKICDFGIAKQVQTDSEQGMASTELTRTGGVLGSPMYMSPEQARSAKQVGATSDVWSLGAALYEALSGRRVWEGHSSVGDLIIAICTKDVPSLQEVAPWIDPGLAEAVHKALQREPSMRHPSMEAFAAALAPFAGDAADLTVPMLAPVSGDVRATVAPRSMTSGTISMAATSLASTGVTPAPEKRSRAGLFVGAAALVAAAAAGTFFVVRSKHETPVAAAPQTSITAPREQTAKSESSIAEESKPAQPAKVKASLKIVPRDSTVLVDGKAAVVTDGILTLEGEPGDSFQVVAKSGARSVSKQVFIGKDGKPSIDTVEVGAGAVGLAVGGKAAVPPSAPTAAQKKEQATAEPPKAPAAPPPPATPPPASTPVGASTF